jgi:hypothetical protein
MDVTTARFRNATGWLLTSVLSNSSMYMYVQYHCWKEVFWVWDFFCAQIFSIFLALTGTSEDLPGTSSSLCNRLGKAIYGCTQHNFPVTSTSPEMAARQSARQLYWASPSRGYICQDRTINKMPLPKRDVPSSPSTTNTTTS